MKRYIVAITSFLVADGIWLGLMSGMFYRPALEPFLSGPPNQLAAFVFYVAYSLSIVILVVDPATEYSWPRSKLATHAALFGAVAYGTYELTNYVTIDTWPLKVVVVDIVWGSLLTTAVALFSSKFGATFADSAKTSSS
jgi:uncharacterized membrane protein